MIEVLDILNVANINIDTLVLMLATVIALFFIFKWHADTTTPFDLRSAFMAEDGSKFSLSKFGQLVAMVTSTWVVIYQTRHNNLTEWLFTGYMVAWAGANAFSKYLNSKKEQQENKEP